MEILLFDNKENQAEIFNPTTYNNSTLFKVKVPLTEDQYTSRLVRGSSLNEEYRKQVVAASAEYYYSGKKWSLCIHVNKNPNQDKNKCQVRVHGFLCEQSLLNVKGVRIRFQLCFYHNQHETNPIQLVTEIPITQFHSTGNFDARNESCLPGQKYLEANDVTFHWGSFNFNVDRYTQTNILGTISLVSDNEDLVISNNDKLEMLSTYQTTMAEIFGKVLRSEIHSDVSIVASDGTHFNCNKVFLAGHSPVFAAMLHSDMKESCTGKIELFDLTVEAIKSLLEYMYTCDLILPNEKCDIALELLKAGHKYEMELLEKRVSAIVMKKEVDWFTVDTAFSLFVFSRNVESMKEIKMKTAKVLMAKRKEFLECKAYKKVFEENLEELANALQELFFLQD